LAKIFFNKSPLVFEIKITKNWVKIVSTIVSCQNLGKNIYFSYCCIVLHYHARHRVCNGAEIITTAEFFEKKKQEEEQKKIKEEKKNANISKTIKKRQESSSKV
jgi:hypothetical protein